MAPTQVAMEDQKPLQRTSSSTSAKTWGHLETSKAAEPVWLMKCPPNVAKSFKPHSADDGGGSPSEAVDSGPIAKVILSLDPLNTNNEPKVPHDVVFVHALPFPVVICNLGFCFPFSLSFDFSFKVGI